MPLAVRAALEGREVQTEVKDSLVRRAQSEVDREADHRAVPGEDRAEAQEAADLL